MITLPFSGRDVQARRRSCTTIKLDLQGIRSVPAWLNLMLTEPQILLATPSDKLNWMKLAAKTMRLTAKANMQDDALAHHKLGRTLAVFRNRMAAAEAAFRTSIELDPKFALAWHNLGNVLREVGRRDEAEAAYRKSIQLDPELAWPHSNVALFLHEQDGREFEAINEALLGLKLRPRERHMQRVFGQVCFRDRTAMQQALPEVCLWSSAHPDEKGVVSFLLDAWLAYAKLVGTAGALELLRAQSAEVQLMFETLSDPLLAHTEPDHLHRLAPERRAPILKLLERLKPQGPS